MLKQPVGVVKLTNVSLIKYKYKGKRLEIACYKNKVVDFRNGVEKSIQEVLQSDEIFTNTVQGKKADKKLLNDVFPNKTKEEILEIILLKGDMQFSGKEREMLTKKNYNEIIEIVSRKIVHPKSKKLFSVDSVKAALKEINFNTVFNKIPKRQALDAITKLEKHYEIERTGKILKINFTKEDFFEKLQKKFEFQIFKKNSETDYLILVSYIVSKELEKFVNSIKCSKFVIIDHAYYSKENQGIDEDIQTDLKIREGVKLPNQRKKSEKEKIKNVIGFDFNKVKNSSGKKGEKKCSTCGETFLDLKVYKVHIRSDFHKFNLKRKMKGEVPVSEVEFKEDMLMREFVKGK